MAGLSYQHDSTDGYGFGFNNQEREGDLGAYYACEHRVYDARLGKWLSIDPLSAKYPSLSPYNFSNNEPILLADKDGGDFEITIDKGVITICAKIYPINAEAANQLGAAVAAWNQLSGSKVMMNGSEFIVNVNITVEAVPASPAQAFSDQTNNDDKFSNLFCGENKPYLDASGALYPNVSQRIIKPGSKPEVIEAGICWHGHIITSLYLVEIFQNILGAEISRKSTHFGQNIRTVAHEIGHIFGLDDPHSTKNPNPPYHPIGGVMEYYEKPGVNSEKMPSIWDLCMVIQVGLDYAAGKVTNNVNELEVNAIIAPGFNFNPGTSAVSVPITQGATPCGPPAQNSGSDPNGNRGTGSKLELLN